MALLELNALLSVPAGGLDREGDLAAARAGDRAAFGRLVRSHQARVFGVALRTCGNRGDAEEVAQDVFLQLHANLAAITDDAHLRHWLLRTAAHRAIDRRRRHARRPVADPAVDPAAVADDARTDTGDPLLQRALGALLDDLPAPARAVVVLRYQEDLDPEDIAASLAMPVNTVKSHLRRSLLWLRARLPESAS